MNRKDYLGGGRGAEKCPKIRKGRCIQVQEAHASLIRPNQKRSYPGHIIIQLLTVKHKKQQIYRKNYQIPFQGSPITLRDHFSSENISIKCHRKPKLSNEMILYIIYNPILK